MKKRATFDVTAADGTVLCHGTVGNAENLVTATGIAHTVAFNMPDGTLHLERAIDVFNLRPYSASVGDVITMGYI